MIWQGSEIGMDDAEVAVLARCVAALETLDPDPRARVLDYLSNRFEESLVRLAPQALRDQAAEER
jgi:hypothetical protein